MAAHLSRLVIIVLVIRGSAMAGSEEPLQRVKRDDDDDDDERRSSSGSVCPCTQGCCDHGWIQYKDACYLPELQNPKIWDKAEEFCAEKEAHLASVHSHEEDNFILHLMGNAKNRHYWLGAKRIMQGEEFLWTWTDESPFQYEKFSKSPAPEEHQNHLSAVRVTDRGAIVWNYHRGHAPRLFICKYFLV
uniref:snaclec agglucetin subunit alpha-1-like n=1 Tax=Euleptes europaea TaxID=460621 RepID=UPI0025415CE6|nr:snaclec agglucetin subunit alpha-1-like [Euleptes europaea]